MLRQPNGPHPPVADEAHEAVILDDSAGIQAHGGENRDFFWIVVPIKFEPNFVSLSMLDLEFAYFLENQDKWSNEHYGKYVVVVGIYGVRFF